ncbi:carboxyl transferase domain-containing protein [Amycolatopsis suaedae]|uniref:Acetyl-coenzyme A carboxylase carboxyl transferase subunits beta/alpha n=1 Tax=Amycolatopsis suaedae TaxID=2510978 RepID=A0A4Q7J8M4_9PSEU|nr:carboxyl transferase domain-containing protein [Amycolatopsis suaedae]RZQ64060.1 acetyl-CoA carboxylase [Amycolatopsis suaedae]
MGESARSLLTGLAADFAGLPDDSAPDDPIGWPGYPESRERAVRATGETESVLCGTGTVGGTAAMLVAFEFGFLGGSVGGRTGARIEAAFDEAVRRRLPVVSLVATGGSRMQEGMRALSQLQRIAGASTRHRAAGLAQLSVLRNPTTGGGWATLGSGGDVVVALEGAQVGFAGSRVRPHGDHSAYTAAAQVACGSADELVTEADLPSVLAHWLTLLTTPAAHVPPPGGFSGLKPVSGWASVQAARAPDRPRARAYLDAYLDSYRLVSGDRCGGVDDGVLCGFGTREGATVAFAAQCGTPTTAAGFRTAARLVGLADRLGIPVLTLVDTPGAANDAAAERAGIGPAIGQLFGAIAAARVPVTSLVIGEGGSGGALAFAAPGRTWMTADSYFSVTSPEAVAAILKLDPADVPSVADRLRLRPWDVVELGVAEGIV